MVRIYRNKCNKALSNFVFHKIMEERQSRPPVKLGKFSMVVNKKRIWGNLFEYSDFENIVLGYKIVNQEWQLVNCYYAQRGR